ncbi:hypothetical protein LguiA_007827 [Lonicera macranthoides]
MYTYIHIESDLAILHYLSVKFRPRGSTLRTKQKNFFMKLGRDDLYNEYIISTIFSEDQYRNE